MAVSVDEAGGDWSGEKVDVVLPYQKPIYFKDSFRQLLKLNAAALIAASWQQQKYFFGVGRVVCACANLEGLPSQTALNLLHALPRRILVFIFFHTWVLSARFDAD